MSELYNGGELVVKVLEEFEARFVFGVPGGQTLSVNNALYDSKVRFVHTRHENSAATAADGYGRLTGEPGICLATTGPGATNLITGIGGALNDSSPVIALVFQNKLADAGRGDAQESNHQLIFQSICKKYIPVRDVKALVWAMREAYRTAKTGKPGPVVVDIYRDVVEEQKAEYVYKAPSTYCKQPEFMPTEEDLIKATDLIRNNKKICLWIGNGVKKSGAEKEIKELSSLICAPIVTTYNGIATIEEDFENLIGPQTRHGSEISKMAIEEADCVIAIGTSMSGVSTRRWTINPHKLIHIDITPEIIGKNYPFEIGLLGDAKITTRTLIKTLKNTDYEPNRQYLLEILGRKKKWKNKVFSGPIADVNANPVPPIALHLELSKCLNKDSIFVVDAGNPGAWTHITSFPVGTTYMKPVNFGNMGFALGAAIGCKEADPDRDVIALIGDGSLGMTLAELETISREKLKIIVILVNDNAYGNIRQEEKYKTGSEKYTGVDFIPIDYVNIAREFGFETSIVRKASEISDAMNAARTSKNPYLIEVKLDGSFTVWPSCF